MSQKEANAFFSSNEKIRRRSLPFFAHHANANPTATNTHRKIMTTSAIPRQQAYGINRRRIGDVVVTLINDGFEDFSFDILSDNITPDEAKALLEAADLPPIPRMTLNVYVVQDGHRTILIDGGDASGHRTGGRLQYALSAANIDASQIDTILLTHAHPDHAGGLQAITRLRFFRTRSWSCIPKSCDSGVTIRTFAMPQRICTECAVSL